MAMKLIYCIDKELKDFLINHNYNFLYEQNINGIKSWVFEYQPKFTFENIDNKKFMIMDTIRF